jgi:predicted membrane-bound spermidine synthase
MMLYQAQLTFTFPKVFLKINNKIRVEKYACIPKMIFLPKLQYSSKMELPNEIETRL